MSFTFDGIVLRGVVYTTVYASLNILKLWQVVKKFEYMERFMKLFHWASIAVLLLVAVTLQGCTEKADGLSKKSADDETPLTAAVEEVVFPVQVAAAERGSISEYLETTARIQAETRVEVVAKGSGHCGRRSAVEVPAATGQGTAYPLYRRVGECVQPISSGIQQGPGSRQLD